MSNGIVNWWVKNTETGVVDDREFLTREDAEKAAHELTDVFPYNSHTCVISQFFMDGAPFHVAVIEKQEATPQPRLGDSLDVAEPLDELIDTLFSSNSMGDFEREACYRTLCALHGSTYAIEWYNSTWYDPDAGSHKKKDTSKYTVVAFTRHETTFNAHSPRDAKDMMRDKLCNGQFLEADLSNTVFDALPVD